MPPSLKSRLPLIFFLAVVAIITTSWLFSGRAPHGSKLRLYSPLTHFLKQWSAENPGKLTALPAALTAQDLATLRQLLGDLTTRAPVESPLANHGNWSRIDSLWIRNTQQDSTPPIPIAPVFIIYSAAIQPDFAAAINTDGTFELIPLVTANALVGIPITAPPP